MEELEDASMSQVDTDEQCTSLQEETQDLKDSLHDEGEEGQNERVSITCKDQISSELQDKAHSSSDLPRRSERLKVQTEKMTSYLKEEIDRKEKKLITYYELWKTQVRQTRVWLKSDITEEKMSELADIVEQKKEDVLRLYSEIRNQAAPSLDIRRKVDSCEAVTDDIIKIILFRISGVDGDFDAEREGFRLRGLLKHDYALSVYGSTAASERSQQSLSSQLTTKRADAAAELAAKEAEYEIVLEEQKQKEKIIALEEEHKKQMAELERLRARKDVNTARARFHAYDRELTLLDDVHSVKGEHTPTPQRTAQELPSNPMQAASPSVAQIAKAVQDGLNLNRLPTPEPTVFSGEPISFIEWKSMFVSLIEQKCISAADKLYYLKRYVTGPARKCLEGTFFRNDEEAYKEAWNKLNQRYGQPFVVQKAFRDKLSNWPKVQSSDADGLRAFADFINACMLAMPHVRGLHILNDSEENQKMLLKLPDWIIARWNRQVTKTLMEGGEFPSFSDFASFLSLEAEVACNPITSIQALHDSDKGNTKESKRNKASVFNTNTAEESDQQTPANGSPCMLCQDTHRLNKCPNLLEMSLENRKKYVRDNRLCYSCLKQGHNAKDCKRRLTCETCTKRHPTCLHDDNFSSYLQTETHVSTDNTTQGNSPEIATVMSLNVARSEQIVSTSMIVPVWLSTTTNPHKEKLVYALLDTQSDTVFVDQEVTHDLQADVCPVKLKLTTMMGKNAVISSGKVSNLIVRGYNSATVVKLPNAYMKEYIPANREHIPTCETAKQWSHLLPIVDEVPPLLSCEVSLLIGYTCPGALAPKQVILGKENEPYAIRTDLGWSIVGNSVPRDQTDMASSLCHRVTVKEIPPSTPADAIRALEGDFKETDGSERTVSQEDSVFLQKLEHGITQTEDGHFEMPLPFKEKPEMPDNKHLAEIRLNQLKRKLTKDEKYEQDYMKYMSDIIKRGDAEMTDDNGSAGETWHIPHHGIYLPKKDTIDLPVGDPEVRKGQTLNTETAEVTSLSDRLTKFSSWSHAARAVARLRRYLLKDKSKTLATVTERQNAEIVIIKDLQRQTYQNEIETLSKGKQLPKTNKLCNLDVFLDKHNVLKVGGRLHHSSLPSSFKHPIIIPREYLQNIMVRQRWHTPKRNMQIGDVIIDKDEMQPRSQWKLGRVLDIVKDLSERSK